MPERLRIWQELLTQPEGTNYEEFCRRCAKQSGVNYVEYEEQARKDLTNIKQLLETTDAEIVTFTVNRKKQIRLSSEVDLLELFNNGKVVRPYQELLHLLTRMNGFLPQEFLSELSSVYKSIAETKNEEERIVSFDTDYSIMAEMRYFAEIYQAISKQGLLVTRHRVGFPELTEKVILYPEYLKQYNSEWHVMGILADPEQEDAPQICGRIPLMNIDFVEKLSPKEYPFQKSGTDYTEYFDEIIGVEYDKHCALETVKLRVSREIYNRLQNNPLHSTQRDCKELNSRYTKGIMITVRKNKELIRTLLNLGKDVEVVAPEKLRRQLARELKATLKYYE